MDRDRLFSFQDSSSYDCDRLEYEEAILERDKIITKLFEETEQLKKDNEKKENQIQNHTKKIHKFKEKLIFYRDSMKKLSENITNYKKDFTEFKQNLKEKLKDFHNVLINNENFLNKQTNFKKNFLKKLKEMNNNRRSTMDSENADRSEPYLNLITKNFETLKEKMDNISNNFRESRTKNFLINFPETTKLMPFQSKNTNRISSHILFSPVQNENSLNNSKKITNFYMQSNRSVQSPQKITSSKLDMKELHKIKEKYHGFDLKFKNLILNLQSQEKITKLKNFRERIYEKNEIMKCLQKIDDRLGMDAKIKEESFQGLLNHFNYKSF